MICRREVALGGLLTILSGSCDGWCQPLSGTPRRFGCVIPAHEGRVLLARSPGHQFYATGNEAIITSSGNRNFDYALAQTLSRITTALEVLPAFAYFDDLDGANAYATDVKHLARADGAVLFGRRLLQSIMAETDSRDVAFTAVCAHEYGHIVQFKLGLLSRLLVGTETVKRVELHADFLSGYYAGVRKLQKPDYPAAVFAKQFHSMGNRNVNEAGHHGTPEERAAAIVRGFETSYRERRSLSDSIEIGIQYVSSL